MTLNLSPTKRFSSYSLSTSSRSTFRIATYNVLADCYVRVPDQPWNAFAYCTDECIDWNLRTPKLLNEIESANADILCLQEVVFEQRDGMWSLPAWCDSLLAEGYCGIMHGLSQKEISKNAARNLRMVGTATPTGLAIFYKKNAWVEVLPSKHGQGSGSTIYLKSFTCESMLLAVNTVHLVGDPSKFDMQTKQLQSAVKSFSCIEQHAAKIGTQSGHEVVITEIICGDFNGDVNMASVEAGDGTVSGWFKDQGFTRVPTGATWADNTSVCCLDHIMYRVVHATGLCSSHLELMECSPANDDVALSVLPGGLPNEHHPSDHILVHATMALTITSQ